MYTEGFYCYSFRRDIRLYSLHGRERQDISTEAIAITFAESSGSTTHEAESGIESQFPIAIHLTKILEVMTCVAESTSIFQWPPLRFVSLRHEVVRLTKWRAGLYLNNP